MKTRKSARQNQLGIGGLIVTAVALIIVAFVASDAHAEDGPSIYNAQDLAKAFYSEEWQDQLVAYASAEQALRTFIDGQAYTLAVMLEGVAMLRGQENYAVNEAYVMFFDKIIDSCEAFQGSRQTVVGRFYDWVARDNYTDLGAAATVYLSTFCNEAVTESAANVFYAIVEEAVAANKPEDST